MNLKYEQGVRVLAIIGILILLGAVLRLNIPLVRILITLGVAWAALNLTGGKQRSFSGISDDHQSGPVRTCRYVFSGAVIDLTDSGALPEKVILQTTLSGVTVRLPVDAASVIHASCSLGSISIPGCQNIVLGEGTAHCGSQDPNAPRVFIDASCALGSVTFEMG